MKKQWGIIAIGMGLILLLGILAAGMDELVLCHGHDIPTEREMGQPGGAFPLPTAYWIIWMVYIMIAGWIISLVFLFIFFPQTRKWILLHIPILFLLLIVGHLLHGADRVAVFEEEKIPAYYQEEAPPVPFSDLDLPPSEPVDREEPLPIPEAPGWAIYAAAGLLGPVLALFLLVHLRRKPKKQRPEDGISEVAFQASEELRQGLPVRDVVMRCWTRMVEILSFRSGVRNAPNMTPREFARLLNIHGFNEQAVDRLTRLFEEVRYGNMQAEPRREEALAAVSDIEHAYG